MDTAAMIFAAGLGTRLRPLTDTCPKALIEVGGKPMLQRAIDAARCAGASRIVVNIHHHAPMMRRWLEEHCPEAAISDESDQLLDTGGGLAKAGALIGEPDTLLVINADILTDAPLDSLADFRRSTGADVALLAWDRESSRRLLFDASGGMRGWKNMSSGQVRPASLTDADALTPLAFGGIHAMAPRAIRRLQQYAMGKGAFSITDFYIDCCTELDIRAFTPQAPFTWIDIGRPASLEKARALFS